MADSLHQIERKAQGNKSIFTLIKLAGAEWSDDDAATWSAALACYAILALAPLAVLALKVFTFFTSSATAQDRLQQVASQWMGGSAGDAIHEIIVRASQPGQGKWAAAISLIIAVVSAGGVLAELQQAMNRIWKVKAKAENAALAFIKARGMSLIVLAISGFVLLSSVIVTSWIEKITSSFGMSWTFLTWTIDAVASAIVATLIFALLYRTLPDVKIEWKATWVGAAFSALLFLLGKYGLAAYFKFGSPTSAFGAVGSLAAVLIWVYYSCMIIFFGAELTQVFVKLYGYKVQPAKHARWLRECDETETATPSKYDPGDKALRPYEGIAPKPASKPRAATPSRPATASRPLTASRPAMPLRPVAAEPSDYKPAIIVSTVAAAAAAGFIAWHRQRTSTVSEAKRIARVSDEIDLLSTKVAALAPH